MNPSNSPGLSSSQLSSINQTPGPGVVLPSVRYDFENHPENCIVFDGAYADSEESQPDDLEVSDGVAAWVQQVPAQSSRATTNHAANPARSGERPAESNLVVLAKPRIIAPAVPPLVAPAQAVVAPSRPARVGCADITTDFIEDYASWADVYELPREVHELFAIQLAASLLNRSQVTIDWGGYKVSFDLWIAVLASSGGGKNTARSVATKVIDAAKIENLIDNTDWGSKEAFYQLMSGEGTDADHTGSKFYIWEEFSYVMKKLGSPAFDGVKQWLTNSYDNFVAPATIRFRVKRQGTDTPPIEFHNAPRTNIVALTAETWFFDHLSASDSTGGFIPRWIIERVPASRFISKPLAPDPRHLRKHHMNPTIPATECGT